MPQSLVHLSLWKLLPLLAWCVISFSWYVHQGLKIGRSGTRSATGHVNLQQQTPDLAIILGTVGPPILVLWALSCSLLEWVANGAATKGWHFRLLPFTALMLTLIQLCSPNIRFTAGFLHARLSMEPYLTSVVSAVLQDGLVSTVLQTSVVVALHACAWWRQSSLQLLSDQTGDDRMISLLLALTCHVGSALCAQIVQTLWPDVCSSLDSTSTGSNPSSTAACGKDSSNQEPAGRDMDGQGPAPDALGWCAAGAGELDSFTSINSAGGDDELPEPPPGCVYYQRTQLKRSFKRKVLLSRLLEAAGLMVCSMFMATQVVGGVQGPQGLAAVMLGAAGSCVLLINGLCSMLAGQVYTHHHAFINTTTTWLVFVSKLLGVVLTSRSQRPHLTVYCEDLPHVAGIFLTLVSMAVNENAWESYFAQVVVAVAVSAGVHAHARPHYAQHLAWAYSLMLLPIAVYTRAWLQGGRRRGARSLVHCIPMSQLRSLLGQPGGLLSRPETLLSQPGVLLSQPGALPALDHLHLVAHVEQQQQQQQQQHYGVPAGSPAMVHSGGVIVPQHSDQPLPTLAAGFGPPEPQLQQSMPMAVAPGPSDDAHSLQHPAEPFPTLAGGFPVLEAEGHAPAAHDDAAGHVEAPALAAPLGAVHWQALVRQREGGPGPGAEGSGAAGVHLEMKHGLERALVGLAAAGAKVSAAPNPGGLASAGGGRGNVGQLAGRHATVQSAGLSNKPGSAMQRQASCRSQQMEVHGSVVVEGQPSQSSGPLRTAPKEAKLTTVQVMEACFASPAAQNPIRQGIAPSPHSASPAIQIPTRRGIVNQRHATSPAVPIPTRQGSASSSRAMPPALHVPAGQGSISSPHATPAALQTPSNSASQRVVSNNSSSLSDCLGAGSTGSSRSALPIVRPQAITPSHAISSTPAAAADGLPDGHSRESSSLSHGRAMFGSGSGKVQKFLLASGGSSSLASPGPSSGRLPEELANGNRVIQGPRAPYHLHSSGAGGSASQGHGPTGTAAVDFHSAGLPSVRHGPVRVGSSGHAGAGLVPVLGSPQQGITQLRTCPAGIVPATSRRSSAELVVAQERGPPSGAVGPNATGSSMPVQLTNEQVMAYEAGLYDRLLSSISSPFATRASSDQARWSEMDSARHSRQHTARCSSRLFELVGGDADSECMLLGCHYGVDVARMAQ